MPAGVAAASDEAGRGVPGPTADRPGVPRRGGAGRTLELLRSSDGVRRIASCRVRREPRAKEGDTRRTALSLGARGESRGRREQVRSGGLARQGERVEGALTGD
jgi:hypothetical protein